MVPSHVRPHMGKELGVASMVNATAILYFTRKTIAHRKIHSIVVRNDVPVEVHSIADMHVCMHRSQASIQPLLVLTSEVMQMLAWPWKAPWVCRVLGP